VKDVVGCPGALRAALVSRFGPRRFRAFRRRGGDPATLADPDPPALAALLSLTPAEANRLCRRLRAVDLEDFRRRLDALGAVSVTWRESAYPSRLERLHDPPPALFVRGRLDGDDEFAAAVVGARRASRYGLRVARTLAADLARAGVTVVSGLARGIDAAAHEGALEAGGRTVAVLGSGLSRPYPIENLDLLERIVESGGAVISEMPLDEPPRPRNFPRRNRIVAALSRAVVVVEAGERSGALSTARHAADLGIDVLAVPGPIDTEHSAGTLALLRDGAAPVGSVEDVLSAFELCRRAPLRLPDGEREVLEAIGPDGARAEDIDAALGLGVDAAAGYLVTLEVRGLVERTEGGRYVVC
jgi:DNA processing protein